MGNGGCGQFITRCLCHSFLLRGRTPHTLPLLQRGVTPMGDSSPQNVPKWVLPTSSSSSQTAPECVPSTRCSPSGTDCSSMGPPRGHKSCQQTRSSVTSSVHRPTGPARSLLQCGLSVGSQPPSGVHLLWDRVLHGLQVDSCSTMDLHGLQGHTLPHHALLHGLQGYLHSNIWSTLSYSFFADLSVCRVVSLTYSHFSLPAAVPQGLNVLSQRHH